jgi:hypothetical protein
MLLTRPLRCGEHVECGNRVPTIGVVDVVFSSIPFTIFIVRVSSRRVMGGVGARHTSCTELQRVSTLGPPRLRP